jgi:hypothetical protein
MKIIDVNGAERECSEVFPDKNFGGYMKVVFVSKVRPGYSHSEWYPISDFLKNNPKLAHLAGKGVQKSEVADDLGVVSTAKTLTLTDKSKKWEKDIFVDFPVWISRGKGEGQIRKVTANTKNTITIDKKWEVIPDKSSQYVLSRNVHDPKALGNTLTDAN